MKQKLTALITAVAALAISVAASAQTIRFQSEDLEKGAAVAAYYDENLMLKGCEAVTVQEERDNIRSFDIQYEQLKQGDTVKLFWVEADKAVTIPNAWAGGIPDAPAPTVTPVPTQSPSPEPTKAPSYTYSPVYPKAGDAVSAPAVVKGVSMVIGEEGENQYAVKVYYQGQERILYTPEDMRLASVPEGQSALSAKSVGVLREGDVVVFTTKLSGKLRDLSLVYRPGKQDIMEYPLDQTGANFEMLFSHSGKIGTDSANTVYRYGNRNTARTQYIFGLIKDRSGNSVTLYNPGGRADHAAEIYVPDNAMIYTYDLSDSSLSTGTLGDLEKSEIPREDMDEDGNVTKWSSDAVHNYVLARIVDDTVTDVFIYLNYNE